MRSGSESNYATLGGILLGLGLAAVAYLGLEAALKRAQAIAPPVRSTVVVGVDELPVVVPAGGRVVPKEVLKTAALRPKPYAAGLRLVAVESAGTWEERRALVEDLVTSDVRRYAIGDLLPYGSLLVGVGESHADMLVADAQMVRLSIDGKAELLEDFRTAMEAAPLPRYRGSESEFRVSVERVIGALCDDDPALVQHAIDELVESGDPALDLLVAHVLDLEKVTPGVFALPCGRQEISPRTVGQILMAALECISGQNFGDVWSPDASADELRAAAMRWRRWWGLAD